MVGLLSEENEEHKYPSWLRWLGALYFVMLLLTSTSVPGTIYDLESMYLVLFLWLPALVGLLYFFEKPFMIKAHKRIVRIIFAAASANAILWGIVLISAFM